MFVKYGIEYIKAFLDKSWFYSIQSTDSGGSCLPVRSLLSIVNPEPEELKAHQAETQFVFQSDVGGFAFQPSVLFEKSANAMEHANRN